MSFLETIRPEIEEQIERRKQDRPIEDLIQAAEPADHSFRRALASTSGPALIAEFKKSSPSQGTISASASLPDYMQLYDRYASAISILTEPNHFSGSPALLSQARNYTDRPLLRKDFIIDEYQIYEARDAGADAVLLIESMLEPDTLRAFRELIEELGMDALMECHDPDGLQNVLDAGARIIGINNRNLDTLDVHPNNVRKLVKQIPENRRDELLIVGESGLSSRADVLNLEGTADAVLIGTSIMDAPNPELKLRELSGRTLVKFCGITNREGAVKAVDRGADVLGLNFYDPSPRCIDAEAASRIAETVQGDVLLAGVFVNHSPEEVKDILNEVSLDLLQFSGDETPEQIREMKQRFDPPVLSAVHVRDESDVPDPEEVEADYMMVDAFDEEQYGGTGKRIDEDHLRSDPGGTEQMVVAGGLTAENVEEVLTELNPFMVDVCSGIETEPGRKDPEAMEAFMDRVRNIHQG